MRFLLAAATLATAIAAGPALAEPWGTDFHMGTYIAYGGSEAEGMISLECVSLGSELEWAGNLHVRVTPAAGSLPESGAKTKALILAGSDGTQLELAVDREGDVYATQDEDVVGSARQELIDMLANGSTISIRTKTTPPHDIAEVPLEGSAAALEGFEDCTDAP